MRIDYDPEADAMYIHLHDGEVDDTLEASKYVYVDVDRDGHPPGVEILFVGRLMPGDETTSVTLNVARMAQQAHKDLL